MLFKLVFFLLLAIIDSFVIKGFFSQSWKQKDFENDTFGKDDIVIVKVKDKIWLLC